MEDYLTTLTVDVSKIVTAVGYLHTHCGGLAPGDRESVRALVAKVNNALRKVSDKLGDIAERDAPPSPLLVD